MISPSLIPLYKFSNITHNILHFIGLFFLNFFQCHAQGTAVLFGNEDVILQCYVTLFSTILYRSVM